MSSHATVCAKYSFLFGCCAIGGKKNCPLKRFELKISKLFAPSLGNFYTNFGFSALFSRSW